jgi:hypothetical protein
MNAAAVIAATYAKQPFPPPPSRQTILTGQITAQGAMITTTQFGLMPWWPGCWAWLTTEDRALAAKQLIALGDEICLIQVALDGRALYDEPNQFYSPDKFPPLQHTLAQTVALVAEAITLGFKGVWLFLDGDNGAYGYPVAVQQVQELAPLMGTLNQYLVYSPGWDGVFYGYTPLQVNLFDYYAKRAGAKYTLIEQQTGHIPVGNGPADYQPGGLMYAYDLVLGEFGDGRFDDSVWQILGRMQRPYVRPPEQPAGDDPNPPFYLASWNGIYRVFEFAMFGFVRRTPAATVQQWRQKFQSMGATFVC